MPLVPLHFIGAVIDIITNSLRKRIKQDIYRGIVLEAVQRIVTDHLLTLAERSCAATSLALSFDNQIDVLLIVHANTLIVKNELLISNIEDGGEITTSKIDTASNPDEDVPEDENELDLGKTRENIWQLLTFSGPAPQYDSVLQFLDESIPRLKRK